MVALKRPTLEVYRHASLLLKSINMENLTVAEINGMKAADMKKLLLASAGGGKTGDSTSALLNTIKQNMGTILEEVRLGKEERASLREEVRALKTEVEDQRRESKLNQECLLKQIEELKEKLNKKISSEESKTDAVNDKYAEAVRSSVRTVMQDEQCKAEMVFSAVEEKGKDQEFVTDLCNKMQLLAKPVEVSRLGRSKPPQTERPRLLKVTFQTAFDARTFRAKYEETKGTNDIPYHRLRSGRTKEQQALFKKNGTITYQLNQESKNAGSNVSYSLRDNGDVWKFSKRGDGKWIREKEWKLDAESGN